MKSTHGAIRGAASRRPRSRVIFPALLLALAMSFAFGGCGLATICQRSPTGQVESSCLAKKLKPGDETWVYTDSGQSVHGIYLRTTDEGGNPGLVLRRLSQHDHGDTAIIGLASIHKVSTPRVTSRASAGVLFGLIVGGVAGFWLALMSSADL
jgi:hypothetical protein